jgi:hypothetical protein
MIIPPLFRTEAAFPGAAGSEALTMSVEILDLSIALYPRLLGFIPCPLRTPEIRTNASNPGLSV